MKKIEKKGEKILRKRELQDLKASYKKPRKKIQTGKILTVLSMILLAVNCVWVERFSMVAMLQWGDLSALPSLITAVVSTTIGEAVIFAIYSAKSYHETKEEEKIKLERERLGLLAEDNSVG